MNDKDARIYTLARIATLEAAETMLQAGRDVMAVIHGDGGHYREAHGDRKAADDAINIIYKLRADLAAERDRRKDAELSLQRASRCAAWNSGANEVVRNYFARYSHSDNKD